MSSQKESDVVEEEKSEVDIKSKAMKSATPATKAKAKAKAKAMSKDVEPVQKAKGKAKAKAKGKALAKAATKSKPNKAKQDTETKDEEKDKDNKAAAANVKKGKTKKATAAKPDDEKKKESKTKAANPKSVKGVQKRLLEASVEEQAEEEEDDAEDGELRDRSKQQKFEMLMAKNQLPAHIVEMWSRAQDDQKNPRKFKTKLVNALFNRDENGKLSMTPHAPFFAAYRETFEKKQFSAKEKALPRGIFIGRYFGNDEAAFLRSLAQGEIEQVDVAGKEWYSVRSLESSHDKYKLETQKLTQTEKKVDAKVCEGLVEAFDNLQWGFNRVANPAIGSARSAAVLAIQDLHQDDMFDKVREVLEDAKSALERLSKETMKMAPTFLSDQKNNALVC